MGLIWWAVATLALAAYAWIVWISVGTCIEIVRARNGQ